MATPVVITLVAVAVGTLAAAALLIVALARTANRTARDLVVLRDRLEPDLDALRRDVEVTQAELARLETTRRGDVPGPPPLPPDLDREPGR